MSIQEPPKSALIADGPWSSTANSNAPTASQFAKPANAAGGGFTTRLQPWQPAGGAGNSAFAPSGNAAGTNRWREDERDGKPFAGRHGDRYAAADTVLLLTCTIMSYDSVYLAICKVPKCLWRSARALDPLLQVGCQRGQPLGRWRTTYRWVLLSYCCYLELLVDMARFFQQVTGGVGRRVAEVGDAQKSAGAAAARNVTPGPRHFLACPRTFPN